MNSRNPSKFVFVTGGVLSSVGKGVVASSIGTLLESRGVKIDIVKCDPYLNVDPGTLSPFQHGEVFVTEDGAETDLDLGHYERFTSIKLKKENSMTTGQIYQAVLEKERKGFYKGKTVQVIPHIVDEIKSRLQKLAKKTEVLIVEIGGTVGDLEGQPFTEALRQISVELNPENSLFVHVSYIPYMKVTGELKSKPTQHSVKALRELGIQPDLLLCRAEKPLTSAFREKIGLFCNLRKESVIEARDVDSIYEVPLKLHEEKFDKHILEKLQIKGKSPAKLEPWKALVQKLKSMDKKGYHKEINIGIVGKYVELRESYKSLTEALRHGSMLQNIKVNVHYIEAEQNFKEMKKLLKNVSAIIVPGGFGDRGTSGKIKVLEWARTTGCPVLGICFGMQLMVVEFARNVCGLKDATSREIDTKTKMKKNYVIDFLENQSQDIDIGGTMRLGSKPVELTDKTLIRKIYKSPKISERHRHRLQLNNFYRSKFSKKGMVFSGTARVQKIPVVECIELKSHPWFIGVQYHPEFSSHPLKPHPLFAGLIKAGLKYNK